MPRQCVRTPSSPGPRAVLWLLLLSLAAASSAAGSTSVSSCAWRICHTVTVDYLPSRSASSDLDSAEHVTGSVEASGGSNDGGGGRSIVLHRCQPSNNFGDKCHLAEFTSDPNGVRNFTMRRAQLTRAPLADLCQFGRLAGLDLAENAIAEFDSADLPRGCLTRLRWLSLRANALREADLSQFMRLPALEKLDLSENPQLESLYLSSQPLATDSSLKVILAAKCRIKQVDISLVRLPSLQDLDLSYNQVSRLTNRLDWRWTLQDVREIEAERNRRRARDPHYYARLSVQLVQNQIGPEAFDRRTLWGLPVPDLLTEAEKVVNQLKLYRDAFQSFLYIDNFGSTIACDCHLLHAWSYLRTVHRDPAEFAKRNALSLASWLRLPCDQPSGGRAARRTIASLSAADLTCVRTEDCPPGCTCLERVSPSEMTVDCRGAGLSAIPDRLPPSVHPVRYVLQLSDNRIRDISAPENPDRIQDLDLSRNLITEAANFAPLAAFRQLHSINLTGNPIRRIPTGLLDLVRPGRVSPRVRIGSSGSNSGGFRCDCQLFEQDTYERLRGLLHSNGLRQLRCMDESTSESIMAEDFRQRYCLTGRQPVINSTSVVVYRERQEVFGQPLLLIGASTAAVFLAAAIVAAVLIVLRCRARGGGPKALVPQPHQPPTPLQHQQQLPSFQPTPAFGCVSPDFLPPPGYSSASLPYDPAPKPVCTVPTPRYFPPHRGGCHQPPAVVLFRSSACDGGGGGGSGGGGGGGGGIGTGGFRPRFRSRSASGSDDCSSSSCSGGVGASGGGGSSGGCEGIGNGGSDPLVSTQSKRHRLVHFHGHVYESAREHGRSRHHRLVGGVGCRTSSASGQPLPRFLMERELLLPPPLPPRTHQTPGAAGPVALVTDV